MRILKKTLLGLLVVILLVGLVGFFALRNMSGKLDALVNADIDMTQVADGVYDGLSDCGLVKVEVEVTVKNHEITGIDLLQHNNGKGKAAEDILEVMVAQNTDNVDAISGATVSSHVIRNAVNLALQKGQTGGQTD